jgi:hypothetical protein
MLLLISSIKLVAEIALMAFIGRFLLGLLVGDKREGNLFYKALSVLVDPFVSATRFITPRFVLPRHVPLAAFFLMAVVWLFATLTKIQMCVEIGVQLCQQ